jgi:hypothetical protein
MESDYDPNLTQHELQTLAMNTDEFRRDVQMLRWRARAYWALVAAAVFAVLAWLTMLALASRGQ